jgi:hypothetical protein
MEQKNSRHFGKVTAFARSPKSLFDLIALGIFISQVGTYLSICVSFLREPSSQDTSRIVLVTQQGGKMSLVLDESWGQNLIDRTKIEYICSQISYPKCRRVTACCGNATMVEIPQAISGGAFGLERKGARVPLPAAALNVYHMAPQASLGFLSKTTPSVLLESIDTYAEVYHHPPPASTLAGWRARARFGAHKDRHSVLHEVAVRPFHPIWYGMSKDDPETRAALMQDIKCDVMDAVSTHITTPRVDASHTL